MARRMTILNGSGDVTIEWDESHDAQIKEWVEALMAKGVMFFVISGGDEVRLKQFDRALRPPFPRKLVMFGGNLDKMVEGVVRQTPGANTEIATTKRATTAAEVVSNDTVATRRAVGG